MLTQMITVLYLNSMVFTHAYGLQQVCTVANCHTWTCHAQLNQESRSQKEKIIQNLSFSYDMRGNILTKIVDGKKTSYAYNTINQLIQIQKPNNGMINLANDYDALGNMKQDPAGNQYHYNLLNQLSQFQNLQIGIKASYQYYANGLRFKKTIISNPMVAPIYDYYDNAKNANVVNETQGRSASSYLFSSGHMVRYLDNAQGNIQKQIAIYDAKDVAAIANKKGKIQKTYHYSPNGIIKPTAFANRLVDYHKTATETFHQTKLPDEEEAIKSLELESKAIDMKTFDSRFNVQGKYDRSGPDKYNRSILGARRRVERLLGKGFATRFTDRDLAVLDARIWELVTQVHKNHSEQVFYISNAASSQASWATLNDELDRELRDTACINRLFRMDKLWEPEEHNNTRNYTVYS